jgi:nitroreductase
MQVITLDELIKNRRSIRKYIDKPVEKGKLRAVIDAARSAPSACNAQPWRFVIVSEPELRNKLIEIGLGKVVPNSWAKAAPAVIVACSDPELLTHNIAEQIQGVKFHLIDMGIALEHIALKAVELGLGTCYIGWFNAKSVKKLLKLPLNWKVECLLTIGYPAEIPEPSKRKDINEICRFNMS